jgi:hypothetical protein
MTALRADGTVRIGGGAGYSGDRIDPAAELASHGDLDYLIVMTLACVLFGVFPF